MPHRLRRRDISEEEVSAHVAGRNQ